MSDKLPAFECRHSRCVSNRKNYGGRGKLWQAKNGTPPVAPKATKQGEHSCRHSKCAALFATTHLRRKHEKLKNIHTKCSDDLLCEGCGSRKIEPTPIPEAGSTVPPSPPSLEANSEQSPSAYCLRYPPLCHQTHPPPPHTATHM